MTINHIISVIMLRSESIHVDGKPDGSAISVALWGGGVRSSPLMHSTFKRFKADVAASDVALFWPPNLQRLPMMGQEQSYEEQGPLSVGK